MSAPTPVITWSKHNCDTQHQTGRTFLQCALGHQPLFYGDMAGALAIIEKMRIPIGGGQRRTDYRVTLFETWPEAREAWLEMPDAPCSGTCRRHQIVYVDLATAERWDTAAQRA